jgi:hypothetical protein
MTRDTTDSTDRTLPQSYGNLAIRRWIHFVRLRIIYLSIVWIAAPVIAADNEHADAPRPLLTQIYNLPQGFTSHEFWRDKLILRSPNGVNGDNLALFDPETGVTAALPSVPHGSLGPWLDPEDEQSLLFADGKQLLSVDPERASIRSRSVAVTLTRDMRIAGARVYELLERGSTYRVLNESTGAVETSGSLPVVRGGFSFRWDSSVTGQDINRVVIMAPEFGAIAEFPYNSNLNCWHDRFRFAGDLVVVQGECGTLSIYDLKRKVNIASLHAAGGVPELSFAISEGLLFVLPWDSMLGGPPLGRVYEMETGKELASFTAAGEILAATHDRLVTTGAVYALDRSQLSPRARLLRIIQAFDAAKTLADRDRAPYRAIEHLDEAGMAQLAADVEAGHPVEAAVVPVLDQYSRWLAQTFSRYPEARVLIEHRYSGGNATTWTPLTARLYHLDYLLNRDSAAEIKAQVLDPSRAYLKVTSDALPLVTIPDSAIVPWKNPIRAAGWAPILDRQFRAGAFVGQLFIAPDEDCSVDIYSAASFEFQRRIDIDRCEELQSSLVASIATVGGRILVLMAEDLDNADTPTPMARSTHPNLVEFDAETLKETVRVRVPNGGDRLDVSSITMLICGCPESGQNNSCSVLPLSAIADLSQRPEAGSARAGRPDSFSRSIRLVSDAAANVGCFQGYSAPGSAAQALGLMASGAWDGPMPDTLGTTYFSVNALRPGASGFFSTDFFRLSPPYSAVSQQLPIDAYSFRDFIRGQDTNTLVARTDPQAIVFAVYDVASHNLHPIIDVPTSPPGTPALPSQMTVAGDWMVASHGHDVWLRRISSPSVVYFTHFNGAPDSLLLIHATTHWVLVRDQRFAFAPQVILLDSLGK